MKNSPSVPNDKRSMPYGGSFAIMDSVVKESMPALAIADPKTFCEKYLEWISSTKLNTIVGLEKFPCAAYSNGTTESFDKFYMKNHRCRFRCFKGEYLYHQLTWRNNWPDWEFIEDAALEPNDAVVISLPFSDTGNEHTQMKSVLKKCTELKIPVLIDCVYFGVCSNINFDFNYDCITDITFSLSKTFPLAYARTGMRLTRSDDDDSLLVLHKIEYTNRIGAALGLALMEKYSPDFIVNKYAAQQKELCQELGVVPSNTVLFGIDTENKYPEYNRGGPTNRLSLHKHFNV